MRILILIPAIVVWQLAAASGQLFWPISGQVRDSTGAPLADVHISDGEIEAATGSDGRYSLPGVRGQIRFRRSGYRPLTKLIERSGTLDVVLDAASESPWSPPVCAAKGRGKRMGQWMQFTLPKGVRVHRGQDDDYRTESVSVRGAWMQFGTGVHWSYGLPPSGLLAQMVSVEERDVKTNIEGNHVADYRGVRADGSRWRTLVTFFESITYDHADAQAAAAFDEILASLCFAGSEVPGD